MLKNMREIFFIELLTKKVDQIWVGHSIKSNPVIFEECKYLPKFAGEKQQCMTQMRWLPCQKLHSQTSLGRPMLEHVVDPQDFVKNNNLKCREIAK